MRPGAPRANSLRGKYVRFFLGFVAACGSAASAPVAPPVVHVEPVASVAIIEDAGPKCAEPVDEPPAQFTGTYPKFLVRLSNDDLIARRKKLLARNPDVEAFLVEEYGGSIAGFTTKKSPYESGDAHDRFAHDRSQIPLDELQPMLDEMKCANPDVARFEPTMAHLSHLQGFRVGVFFEHRPAPTEVLIRDEPLPRALDDFTLLAKWNIGAQVARVHRRGMFEKRVVVGTAPVAKQYMKVVVARSFYGRPTRMELRLVARLEVRWDDFRREVLTPRFGASLEPSLTGNYEELFDAVTGQSFNPSVVPPVY
jgi:hypothetical protein